MSCAVDFQWNYFMHTHLADGFGLSSEPPALFHERLKNFSLKRAYLIVMIKHFLPRGIGFEKLKLSGRAGLVLLFLIVYLEPEITIRSNRDGIFSISNAHESILTECLRDIAIFELRQIERSGLRKLREVGHDNDALFLMTADEAQDFRI